MSHSRFGIVLLFAFSSACASGGGGRPTSAVVTSPAVAGLNTAGPWRVGGPSGVERVIIETQATVTITDGLTVRTDTLHATLGASYNWATGSLRRVDGQLTDYRVAIGSAVPATPAGLQIKRPFSANSRSASGAMTFTLPAESSACTDPALSALQGLQDAWVSLPATLSVGQSWTDTVHTLSCRDRVSLHGTSVRRYQVRRAEVEDTRRLIIIIERSARACSSALRSSR